MKIGIMFLFVDDKCQICSQGQLWRTQSRAVLFLSGLACRIFSLRALIHKQLVYQKEKKEKYKDERQVTFSKTHD